MKKSIIILNILTLFTGVYFFKSVNSNLTMAAEQKLNLMNYVKSNQTINKITNKTTNNFSEKLNRLRQKANEIVSKNYENLEQTLKIYSDEIKKINETTNSDTKEKIWFNIKHNLNNILYCSGELNYKFEKSAEDFLKNLSNIKNEDVDKTIAEVKLCRSYVRLFNICNIAFSQYLISNVKTSDILISINDIVEIFNMFKKNWNNLFDIQQLNYEIEQSNFKDSNRITELYSKFTQISTNNVCNLRKILDNFVNKSSRKEIYKTIETNYNENIDKLSKDDFIKFVDKFKDRVNTFNFYNENESSCKNFAMESILISIYFLFKCQANLEINFVNVSNELEQFFTKNKTLIYENANEADKKTNQHFSSLNELDRKIDNVNLNSSNNSKSWESNFENVKQWFKELDDICKKANLPKIDKNYSLKEVNKNVSTNRLIRLNVDSNDEYRKVMNNIQTFENKSKYISDKIKNFLEIKVLNELIQEFNNFETYFNKIKKDNKRDQNNIGLTNNELIKIKEEFSKIENMIKDTFIIINIYLINNDDINNFKKQFYIKIVDKFDELSATLSELESFKYSSEAQQLKKLNEKKAKIKRRVSYIISGLSKLIKNKNNSDNDNNLLLDYVKFEDLTLFFNFLNKNEFENFERIANMCDEWNKKINEYQTKYSELKNKYVTYLNNFKLDDEISTKLKEQSVDLDSKFENKCYEFKDKLNIFKSLISNEIDNIVKILEKELNNSNNLSIQKWKKLDEFIKLMSTRLENNSLTNFIHNSNPNLIKEKMQNITNSFNINKNVNEEKLNLQVSNLTDQIYTKLDDQKLICQNINELCKNFDKNFIKLDENSPDIFLNVYNIYLLKDFNKNLDENFKKYNKLNEECKELADKIFKQGKNDKLISKLDLISKIFDKVDKKANEIKSTTIENIYIYLYDYKDYILDNTMLNVDYENDVEEINEILLNFLMLNAINIFLADFGYVSKNDEKYELSLNVFNKMINNFGNNMRKAGAVEGIYFNDDEQNNINLDIFEKKAIVFKQYCKKINESKNYTNKYDLCLAMTKFYNVCTNFKKIKNLVNNKKIINIMLSVISDYFNLLNLYDKDSVYKCYTVRKKYIGNVETLINDLNKADPFSDDLSKSHFENIDNIAKDLEIISVLFTKISEIIENKNVFDESEFYPVFQTEINNQLLSFIRSKYSNYLDELEPYYDSSKFKNNSKIKKSFSTIDQILDSTRIYCQRDYAENIYSKWRELIKNSKDSDNSNISISESPLITQLKEFGQYLAVINCKMRLTAIFNHLYVYRSYSMPIHDLMYLNYENIDEIVKYINIFCNDVLSSKIDKQLQLDVIDMLTKWNNYFNRYKDIIRYEQSDSQEKLIVEAKNMVIKGHKCQRINESNYCVLNETYNTINNLNKTINLNNFDGVSKNMFDELRTLVKNLYNLCENMYSFNEFGLYEGVRNEEDIALSEKTKNLVVKVIDVFKKLQKNINAWEENYNKFLIQQKQGKNKGGHQTYKKKNRKKK